LNNNTTIVAPKPMLLKSKFKNLLLITILCAVLCISVQSFGQGFKAKAIIGVNGNQIDGDGLYGFNKPGLLVGAGTAFYISDKWSVEPQLLYSEKGSRSSDKEAETSMQRIIFRMHYIELPIVANYHINPQFTVLGGFSPNYLFRAQLDNGTNLGFVDRTDFFRRMDYCANLGLEFMVTEHLGLNMRWSYSLLSISRGSNLGNLRTEVNNLIVGTGLYNNTIAFSLRYIVKHKKNEAPKP